MNAKMAATAMLGAALIGGVIVWKVVGATYAADVRTICDAELRSGSLLGRDMSALTRWVRANLTTPDGNQFFSSLRDAEMGARATRLRDEASVLGIGACPMVQSYERAAADAEHRSDLQRLCSRVTFPDLAELDDDARLALLEDWIDGQATSPRTRALADPLRRALPAERAGVLRAATRPLDIFSCDSAKVLDVPRTSPTE